MGSGSEYGFFVGLMSGTSMDGIDAVLAHFRKDRSLKIVATNRCQYSPPLKRRIEALTRDQGTPSEIGAVDAILGDEFARCTLELLRRASVSATSITAIGSHGQTVFHQVSGSSPFTMQLGDPNRVAEHTGITTVGDFRRRDIAAGGQGAPLAPAFHQWHFSTPGRDRAIVNLGGIANITCLFADGSAPVGFDTGPGNRLMDLWCHDQWGNEYDVDGYHAAQGRIQPRLIANMLSDPYFALRGPRSTGREYFNREWLHHYLRRYEQEKAEDIQRTLAALTAETVVQGLRQVHEPSEVFLCGGGAFNPVLVKEIRQRMGQATVETTDSAGLDPQAVEGAAFAWLARQRLLGRTAEIARVTGADGPRVLGALYPGAGTLSDAE